MKTFIYLIILFSATNLGAKNQPVNSLIGDKGFAVIMGHYPNSNSNENLRVKCHLLYVAHVLKQKNCDHLSQNLQNKRAKAIDLLQQYALKGKYPKNKYHEATRKPCFIDDEGTICAVGYLLESTEGRALAEEVNNNYQYSEIYEMDVDFIESWAIENGLTLQECAMIQPTYDDIWYRNYQRTLMFSLGTSLRFDGNYYSKFDLAYSFSNVFKRRFKSSVNLQYIPFRNGNYSAALAYYKTIYIQNKIKAFAGLGGELFAADMQQGWNMVPEIGAAYQHIKKRMIFNTQLTYAYHVGLQNTAGYAPNRNEVSLLIGLGFRL
ncbi:MAG: hypothetical protein GQ574_09395 [Crocinitomix sp.]|nr:hypothetical protein [Crocinitomix sp.]